MKRAVIGILVLVLIMGGAIAFNVLSKGKSGPAAGGGSADLVYASPTHLSVPPVGGYQLQTIDLGDGPVPLVTIPLDTWGGYAALFAANKGLAPSKDSLFYKRGHFAVKLAHVESATEQLNGYASGQYPIIWAQMDSLPLLFDAFRSDKRVAPRVLGLFDWSAGGDGVLARNSIKQPSDLKGKTILTSSNTPYAFFLLWYLAQNNLSGNDVKVVWIDDGQKALQLFKTHPDIAAWVSWTPYINDCLNPSSQSYVPDTRLMISSKDANQLIADCYIVRNDFLAANPAIARAFVETMSEAADQIGDATFKDMATFYGFSSPNDARAMLQDVHVANFPENAMFFDKGNTIGANKIFLLSEEYYKQLGSLPAGTSYDPDDVNVADIIPAIAKSGKFAAQKNTVENSFNTQSQLTFSDLESKTVVLTDNVELYFDPNQNTFDVNSIRQEFKDNMSRLDKVAEQTKFLATTAVELIGNADPSRQQEFKGQGPAAYAQAAADLQLLSEQRADFIKTLLVEHYGLPVARVLSKGVGWDNPIDMNDYAKDRRVDVKFVSMR